MQNIKARFCLRALSSGSPLLLLGPLLVTCLGHLGAGGMFVLFCDNSSVI